MQTSSKKSGGGVLIAVKFFWMMTLNKYLSKKKRIVLCYTATTKWGKQMQCQRILVTAEEHNQPNKKSDQKSM